MKLPATLGILAVLPVVSLIACKKPAPVSTPPPPAVTVVQPTVREVVEWDEYTGRLESPQTVEVRARVSGYLERVHFKEGKEVRKGDLLFTIDRRPYKADLDRAGADFERSQNQTELAKSDSDRARRLIETKAISMEDFDTKTRAYASAQAAERSLQANLELARLNHEFTEIRAPIDGRIGRALVTEGNLVAGGPGGPGSALLATIVSQDPLHCYVDIDERSILKYLQLRREGRRVSALDSEIPVEIALVNEEGFPRKGVIDFVDNKLDPATGTVRCRGVIANPDRSLGPGFFARLRIPGSGRYQALLLPERVFGSDQAQKFVFVVGADKKVEFRPVSLGPVVDGERVVAAGLKAGEHVILEGLMRVRPGIEVNPQSWVAKVE